MIQLPAGGSSAASPFFLVGCGRSGTTLLRGLLNAHPLLAIPLESLFIADYLRVAGRWSLARIKQSIVQEPELREWGMDVAVEQLHGCETIAQIIMRLHELYARMKRKPYWGQKTPRLVRHLPLLHQHFPDARFIHLVRDPRAVVSSLIRSDVHRSTPWYGARRWLMDVQAGLEFERQYPDRVFRLSYEELVHDPEARVRAIMEYLKLEFTPGQLDQETGSDEYSEFYANIHSNLERKVTGRFAEAWRSHLSGEDIELIEGTTASLMEALGYRRETDGPTEVDRPRLRAGWQRIRGLGLQLWRYGRYRRTYLIHLLRRKWRMGLLGEFLNEIYY